MSDDWQGSLELRSTRAERISRIFGASEVTASEDPTSILYQHTVMCQTGLPYRDPGKGVLEWVRVNGRVHMSVASSRVMHPERGFVHLGLPFGPKPRLILAHLNAEATARHGRANHRLDQGAARPVIGSAYHARDGTRG